MGSFSDKKFQKLADAIVDDYIDQDIPLEQSIVKVADESGMNIHETRRLVEKTNVTAHQEIYEKLASDDKYVEFNTANPEAVCNELFKNKQSPSEAVHCEKTASEIRGQMRDRDRTKTASAGDNAQAGEIPHPGDRHVDYNTPIQDKPNHKYARAQLYQPPSPDYEEYPNAENRQVRQKLADKKKVERAEDELKDEMNIALANYVDGISKFASRFRNVYGPNFEAFQKKAWALYGDDAAHPLSELEEELGKESLSSKQRQKAASRYERSDRHTDEFEDLIEKHKRAKKYAKALKWHRQNLADKVT